MKNVLSSLTTAATFALSVNAYAVDESAGSQGIINYKDNGGYNSTVKTSETKEDGTSVTSKTTDNVDVDADGNVKEKLKSSSVMDPPGLMNKKTHTGELDYKDKDNGGYEKTLTVKDTDAAGTNVYTKQKTKMDVDAKGNVVETVKTDKTIDPPGLMNKTSTSNTTKTVNGVVVQDDSK